MARNVGHLDRTVRIALGTVAAIVGLLAVIGVWEAGPVVGGVALVVGVVLLVTGWTQSCPVYRGTGVSTLGDGE